MPNITIPAAASGLPFTERHGRIPAGGRADVIPLDRRSILRQLAALSFAATVATAAAETAEADPIFPAIAEHRRLEAAFGDTCSLIDAVSAREEGRTITTADHERFERAEEAADEALEVLLATTPTTVAGIRAMLTYLFDPRKFAWLDDDRERACIAAVLRSPVLAGGAHV
jgi:hypothetical protein